MIRGRKGAETRTWEEGVGDGWGGGVGVSWVGVVRGARRHHEEKRRVANQIDSEDVDERGNRHNGHAYEVAEHILRVVGRDRLRFGPDQELPRPGDNTWGE